MAKTIISDFSKPNNNKNLRNLNNAIYLNKNKLTNFNRPFYLKFLKESNCLHINIALAQKSEQCFCLNNEEFDFWAEEAINYAVSIASHNKFKNIKITFSSEHFYSNHSFLPSLRKILSKINLHNKIIKKIAFCLAPISFNYDEECAY